MIFNKARDEKKTGGKPESPSKTEAVAKHGTVDPVKPQAVSCFLYPLVCLLIFYVTVSISVNIGYGFVHIQKDFHLHNGKRALIPFIFSSRHDSISSTNLTFCKITFIHKLPNI